MPPFRTNRFGLQHRVIAILAAYALVLQAFLTMLAVPLANAADGANAIICHTGEGQASSTGQPTRDLADNHCGLCVVAGGILSPEPPSIAVSFIATPAVAHAYVQRVSPAKPFRAANARAPPICV